MMGYIKNVQLINNYFAENNSSVLSLTCSEGMYFSEGTCKVNLLMRVYCIRHALLLAALALVTYYVHPVLQKTTS